MKNIQHTGACPRQPPYEVQSHISGAYGVAIPYVKPTFIKAGFTGWQPRIRVVFTSSSQINMYTYNIMANKTRNANRKKQLKNKRKSRRQNQKKVKCVMCEKTTCKKSSLVPASCLAKNMDKSHRVCQKCWWDPKKGFALETSSHKCRGCQKNMPLNQSTLIPSVIDLTLD